MMFELIEAVSGRLIGLKTWDRIVGNYLSSFGKFVQSTDCFGAASVQFVL